MNMSTEAVIALLALFVACVPGVRFLVSHRQNIIQWWNRAPDSCQPGNRPERHPTSNAQHNTDSTAQFNPSHTRIDRNDLLSDGSQLPVSTAEISYPTLPPYNPMFFPPYRQGMRTGIISQTVHTKVLYTAMEEYTLPWFNGVARSSP